MTVHYPPVTGHRVVLSDRRDCRYTCTCGLPLGRTRAESVRLHRAHKVNLYAGAADSPCEACGALVQNDPGTWRHKEWHEAISAGGTPKTATE